ncbi:hypothetical protein [Actinocorallia longicatena]|uniref:DUF4367 domain-containing protein n=1 Tax=Actinocorallia longicatena TaxID=111803 RepID=A0ABP6QBD9_9ACTN
MTTDERLHSLIHATVEAEVRDLSFPADLAERVIANTSGMRRWRRNVPSFLLAGAAAAAVLAVVPVVAYLKVDETAQGPLVLRPSDLGHRVTPGDLPQGMRMGASAASADGTLPEVKANQPDTRMWSAVYTYRTADVRPKRVRVWVISGDTDLARTVAAFSLAPSIDATERLPFPVGEAVTVTARSSGIYEHRIVWQKAPGLVVMVWARQLPRATAVSIAKGVKIK